MARLGFSLTSPTASTNSSPTSVNHVGLKMATTTVATSTVNLGRWLGVELSHDP